MGVFEDTMQGLLEAIEMEYGKDYRKEVELKLQQDKGNFIKIDGHSDVISELYSESLHELAKDPVNFIGEMRDATPEEREYINKCIKEISYPTGVCFRENWHLRDNNQDGINEIDTYISEVNSQDNFIAEVNSLPMPETYSHEDDSFYIPEEYKKHSREHLKNVKKAWDDYYKNREEMRKAIFGEGEKSRKKERETNMNERIAQFEKVSYEQFKIDMTDKFPVINKDFIKNIYNNIVKLPIRKTTGSAGYDFVTPVDIEIEPNQTFTIPTGIRCKMRNDFVLNIYVRSSIGFKYQTVLANGTGIIDSDYYNAENEGHIMIKLINHSDKTVKINAGDAFAQGVFLQFGITNDDMADGVRVGGFGSTGKQ